MKPILYLVLTAALAGAGCAFDGPFVQRQEEKPPPAVQGPPPPAVIKEEVNEQNATEKARALREELLRESLRLAPARPASPAPGD